MQKILMILNKINDYTKTNKKSQFLIAGITSLIIYAVAPQWLLDIIAILAGI